MTLRNQPQRPRANSLRPSHAVLSVIDRMALQDTSTSLQSIVRQGLFPNIDATNMPIMLVFIPLPTLVHIGLPKSQNLLPLLFRDPKPGPFSIRTELGVLAISLHLIPRPDELGFILVPKLLTTRRAAAPFAFVVLVCVFLASIQALFVSELVMLAPQVLDAVGFAHLGCAGLV